MKRHATRAVGAFAFAFATVLGSAVRAGEPAPDQHAAPAPGELPGAASDASSPDQIVQALWKEQEISFYFQSFTTFYSCSGLEAKLERILTALGAQPVRVRVQSADCPNRVARMPRVVIHAATPVAATPEAIAEIEKSRSTRELVARVRGERAADVTEQFPAQWRRVSLSRGELGLEPGDCELIDELHRKVLPKLAVRVVQDNLHCTPHQITLGQPRLLLDALVKAPEPDDPPDSAGAAGR